MRRWVLGTSVVLVILGAVLPSILARVAPRFAVATLALDPGGFDGCGALDRCQCGPPDPWGHRMMLRSNARGFPPEAWYSVGPNGIDEDGNGDDVVPTHFELALASRLAAAPKGLVALGVLLAWCGLGPYTRTRRSDSLATESARALALASVATPALMGVVAWLVLADPDAIENLDGLRSIFFVPPVLALLAGDGVLCFLVALAWRLSRPLDTPTTYRWRGVEGPWIPQGPPP